MYDNANRLTKRTVANTQYTELVYDNRSRQTWARHKSAGGTAFETENNVYDSAGRLTTKAVVNSAGTVATTYGYDDADQLTSESRTGYSATYTYDGNGNRLTKTLGGVTQNYAYDDGDKLTAVTQGLTTVKSYGYDGAGRTTTVVSSAGTTTLTYDVEGRVTGIAYPGGATNSFTYNGLSTRVSKVDSSGTATHLHDGVSVTSPVVRNGATTTYTPGVSQRTAGVTTFEMSNRLGTSTHQTNAAGTTTATRVYDAFGILASSTGTPKGPFGFAGNHGYQEDADSSLKLLGHRYYDPSTGRFLTRDPIKDGRNWYVYCENDPLGWVDDDGLDPQGKGKKRDNTASTVAMMWLLLIAGDPKESGKEISNPATGPHREFDPKKAKIKDRPGGGRGGGNGGSNGGNGGNGRNGGGGNTWDGRGNGRGAPGGNVGPGGRIIPRSFGGGGWIGGGGFRGGGGGGGRGATSGG